MSFDHAGNVSIGKPAKPTKKPAITEQTSEIIEPSEAPPVVVESFTLVTAPAPYEEPVTIIEPPQDEPESLDEGDEAFDESEEAGEEYPFEPEPSEPAPLIVAEDGKTIVTATETKRRREERKRGRKAKNKKSKPFIPEGLTE